MGNVILAQSGGPTVAINASLAGVIEGTIDSNYDKIYGSINGILGIRDDNIIDLSSIVASDPHFLKRLKTTPAMYLGSCRFKLPAIDSGDPIYNTLFDQFNQYQIEAFFYIGGYVCRKKDRHAMRPQRHEKFKQLIPRKRIQTAGRLV